MPRTDGQKKGWNDVAVLLLGGENPNAVYLRLQKLPPTSQYLQGGEMAIAEFQKNPKNFALIGA